jgi:hypothetical protein
VNARPSGQAGHLFAVSAQERVARARIRSESNLSGTHGGTIEETVVGGLIPEPLHRFFLSLILADEHAAQHVVVDCPSSLRNYSANRIASVLIAEADSEKLRVSVIALLLAASISVAMHVRVDKIFSQQTKENGNCLIDVVQSFSMVCFKRHEDFHDCRRATQHFFSFSCGVQQAVNEIPG